MITGKTFVIIGTSGSGKSTLIESLKGYLDGINNHVKHFEAGVELKKIAEDGDDGTARTLRNIFKNGGPAPNVLIKNLFDGFLLGVKEDDALIIDGIPRTLIQSVYIDDILSRIDRSRNTIIIHLEVSEEIALERLIERAKSINSNTEVDIDLIKKRFLWYKLDSVPCVTFFSKDKTYKIITINGEGSESEVFDSLKIELEKVLMKKQKWS